MQHLVGRVASSSRTIAAGIQRVAATGLCLSGVPQACCYARQRLAAVVQRRSYCAAVAQGSSGDPAGPPLLRRRRRAPALPPPSLEEVKGALSQPAAPGAVPGAAMSSSAPRPEPEAPVTSPTAPKRRRHVASAAEQDNASPGVADASGVAQSVTPKRRGAAKAAQAAAAAAATLAADAAAAVGDGSGEAAAVAVTSTKRKRGSKASATATAATAVVSAVGEGGSAAAAAVVSAAATGGAGDAAGVAGKGRAKKPKPEPLPLYTEALRPPPPPPTTPHTKILCWNVAGLRALMKKELGVFARLVQREGPSMILLQEHKLQESNVEEAKAQLAEQLPGWHSSWSCSTTIKGYSGVALLSRDKPLAVGTGLLDDSCGPNSLGSGVDPEGRLVTAEFPGFYLASVYVPNSGEGLKRLDYRVGEWDKALAGHVKQLEARGKPVILAGDMNCAHHEIDIHAPATNLQSAGFTPQERASFTQCYTDAGMVDTYRKQFPGVVAYTYFTYKFNCRAKNKGWRLDYFLVSSGLAPRCHDSFLLQDVMGSDHVPIGLTLLRDDAPQAAQ